MKKKAAKQRVTSIVVRDETWHVPRGFGAAYLREVRRQFDLIGEKKPSEILSVVQDLLGLIGYHATLKQIADWDLRKRVEAVIYAATEHARASDNPIPRHPRPIWLPERPWQGRPASTSHVRADLRGAFTVPGGTPIVETSR